MLKEISESIQLKLKAGKYRIPVTIKPDGKKLWMKFGYNKSMITEIKGMEGCRWHGFEDPPIKMWSIKNSPRNLFQLNYLAGYDPYVHYDCPLESVNAKRPLFKHQLEMVSHALTRHYCIFACEMGTGKTLAAIEVMEQSGMTDKDCWYVGPKSGVKAVERELIKWSSQIKPKMLTYEKLVRLVSTWDGSNAPRFVIFDESSKIKTPTSQRSQASMHLANAVRKEYGDKGYVILMSGTPAPKSPVDWFMQAEVACPGFLKEGSWGQLKKRLCLIEQRESITGGVYPHIVTWLNDSNKCAICGSDKSDSSHNDLAIVCGEGHEFKESVDEVSYLYKRMQGLVLVKFKKDCLELPEKQYVQIQLIPDPSTIQLAKLIKSQSPRAITALTLLRELSDGFQYQMKESDTKSCKTCNGTGRIIGPILVDGVDITDPMYIFKQEDYYEGEKDCDECGGFGDIKVYSRVTANFNTPKDEQLISDLSDHEDVGRIILWGGFTGTIDKLVTICHQQGWHTLRVDGRGYHGETATGEKIDSDELLDAMDGSSKRKQELLDKYPKLAFVGHPKAGGMALTLTASPTEIFYSNVFDGEARMQAEDRFHRPGMDLNRGAIIMDYLHLSTDKLVLDNLKKKKRLQSLTLGDINV